MKNIVTTQNLTKSYGNNIILNNVNIHIPEGQIYCLLGPNGAGKTTFMKILSGIILKTSGEVLFEDKPWKRKDLKYIGSLIENPPLYSNLTAIENMKVISLLKNTNFSYINDLLNTVGLSNTQNKLVSKFSLGMKERLGIALALVGHPKFLILDEPTNGLDPQGITELRKLIINLKNKGITILISSHMLSEVEKLADNIGFIKNGKLLKEESYDHSSNLEELFNNLSKEGDINE